MLGFKLNHVSKRGPRGSFKNAENQKLSTLWLLVAAHVVISDDKVFCDDYLFSVLGHFE